MNRRQSIDGHRVLPRDREFLIIVIDETAPQHSRVHLKIVPPQAALDRNLPQARRAIDQLVARIAQQCTGRDRQPPRLTGRLQQKMSIQQNPHPRP